MDADPLGSVAAVAYTSANGLADRAISPWGAWPPAIGDEHRAALVGSPGFAIARSPGAAPSFGLLFLTETKGPSPAAHLAASVSTELDYNPFEPGPAWPIQPPATALGLARGATTWASAWTENADGNASLSAAMIDDAGKVAKFAALACSNSALPAAVSQVPGGFLLAAASSAPHGQCASGPAGFATRVQISLLQESSMTLVQTAEINAGDPVIGVALVARQGGAFLLFQTETMTSGAPGPLRATRLDNTGGLAGLTSPLETGVVVGPWAAAKIAGNVVVAYTEQVGNVVPTLTVSMHDLDGARLATQTIMAPGEGTPGPIAILASHDERQALLSWVLQSPSQVTVEFARITCNESP